MIHYHGTPCGGTREDVARFLSGRHALIPWQRPEDIATAGEVCQSFCIDNGAFTAWKQGLPVKCWDGYYAWLGVYKRHPGCDWAIIPDVIDGTEADNDALEREWPHAKEFGVPVWHLHESLGRLERMVHEWPRIALGSSGTWSNPGSARWWERMAEAMKIACTDEGKPLAKLHGLRMLDPAIFHRLPLASADSTNAVRNSSGYSRFGMYCPPNASTRMSIIAERIEAHQSAATWRPLPEQPFLAFGEQDGAAVIEAMNNERTEP